MATGKVNRAGKWVTDSQAITLPWTAPCDGFVYADLNPNSSTISYYYIFADTTTAWANIVARDGTRTQCLFPVSAGKTYSLTASSNVKNVTLRFFALS